MSNAIFEQFNKGMKTLNTELTKAFALDGTRCFLLKRKVHSKDFEIITEIEKGFYSQWSEFRQQTLFSFAGQIENFIDLVAQTSFVGYGVIDADNAINVFEIQDETRDKIVPDASSPFYKLFANRIINERFIIP